MRKAYIYTLSESGSEIIRYVGKTVNPRSRLVLHAHDCSTNGSAKEKWIAEVMSRGGDIAMDIVETCDNTNVAEREQYWINFYMSDGEPLLNSIMSVVPSKSFTAKDQEKLSFRISGRQLEQWNELRAKYPRGTDKIIFTRLLNGNVNEFPDEDSLDLNEQDRVMLCEIYEKTKQIESMVKEFGQLFFLRKRLSSDLRRKIFDDVMAEPTWVESDSLLAQRDMRERCAIAAAEAFDEFVAVLPIA